MPTDPTKRIDGIGRRVLESLAKNYVVIGTWRIRSWYAWLFTGIACGAVIGLLAIANRSGKIEPSEAALPAPRFNPLARNPSPLHYGQAQGQQSAFRSGVISGLTPSAVLISQDDYGTATRATGSLEKTIANSKINSIYILEARPDGSVTRRKGALSDLAPGMQVAVFKKDSAFDLTVISTATAPLPAPSYPPYQRGINPAPIGTHLASDCSATTGWVCDASNFGQAPAVLVYADAPAGAGGAYLSRLTANLPTSPPAGASCGTASNNRGFSFPTPASLKTGTKRLIFVYSVDSPSGAKTLLKDSPKKIRCSVSGSP